MERDGKPSLVIGAPGKLLEARFSRDLIWNYGSFAVLALAGVTVNVVIGLRYGTWVVP